MLRTLIVIALLAPLPARAGDWPQWRGRDRDGHAHGVKLPAAWPEAPPQPLWRRTVGEGQSSPVVAGGRLFILGRIEGVETCWCLDVERGGVLWKHGSRVKYKPADRDAGEGPKSTPTVDGSRAYMLGVAGLLHCFDVESGQVVWKRDLGKEFWGVTRDKHGDDAYSTCCGAAASPLVYQGRVLLPVGGQKAGALTAFDRDTGQVVWKSPLKDRSSYGSGVVADLGGFRQVVGFTGLRIGGFSLKDGSLLWGRPFEAQFEQTVLTPVVWKGRVIVGGEERPTLALEVRKAGGKVMVETAWENDRLKAYLTSPVAVKDRLYGLSKRGELVCVDLADGKTVWAGGDFGTYGTLVAAGETLLVFTSRGELHVIRTGGKKLARLARWRLTENTPTWSHLAVAGGRLYIKDKTDVLCFDLPGR